VLKQNGIYSPLIVVVVKTLFLVGLLSLLIGSFSQVRAANDNGNVIDGENLQTNPKIRQVEVTAIMPDVLPPSTPVLISPENHSLLNQNQITFSWYGSTDNVGMDHYQIWFNGKLYLDNIPLISTGTTAYTLTVDPLSGIYYLTLHPPLADGAYTWKIVAVDTSDNTSSSAIWDFILDTQAPIFIINKVDTTATSISAYDPHSIPTKPIKIVNPDPWIDGVGEVDSQVVLTLIDGNQVIATYRFMIDNKGHWQVNLNNVLPRDKVVFMNFIITDKVGNVSLLQNVPIIYPTKYIEIKVPAVIAPPANQSPTKTKPPSLKVPLYSPGEIKLKISKAIERFLPPGAKIFFTNALNQAGLISYQYPLTNWLALILLATPFITSLFWLLGKTRAVFNLANWQAVFWALEMTKNKPGGIVITYPQLKPLKRALVKVIRIKDQDLNQQEVITKFLTNSKGVFPLIKINQSAKYRYYLDINHHQVGFPSLSQASPWLQFTDWYQQQLLTVTESQSLPILTIPVDSHEDNHSWLVDLWYKLAKLTGKLVGPHLLLIGLVTFFFSSPVNLVAFAFYLIKLGVDFGLKYTVKYQRIRVLDETKRAIPNFIVQIYHQLTNQQVELIYIGQTNVDGIVRFTTDQKQILVKLIHPQYFLPDEASPTAININLDNSKNPTIITRQA